ncbi:hypothetical protein PGT21_031947 [Puccinia graminis f. sp. tritici]|uniref:Uncharacterized protein n=1 Tax=Puccinia graminis f. sp. tritici TaxID=56615 RepID=A0A5B0Q494_PUCGR|nr:hypothetical protein PGT21_031947 [Puccinia graminis f. sp. tritici]KAA1107922.1 hypothetical protein PGTUg99_010969 [Puccinia graminis f. sp. tritici]
MSLRIIHLAITLVIAASSLSHAESDTVFSPMSLESIHDTESMLLLERYQIGGADASVRPTVEVYSSTKSAGSSFTKRDSNTEIPGITKPLDLTPSKCNSKACYPGSFGGPKKTDCDAIVDAQLYHSVGSLTVKPGNYVLVYAGTCVVVFQHPMGKDDNNLTLDYNWAKLGLNIIEIQKKCDKPEAMSIGGACRIKSYLKYNFENLLISLQRYVAPENPQTPIKPAPSSKPGNSEKPGNSGNSGNPEKPGNSNKPGQPEKPGQPQKPGQPEKPKTPPQSQDAAPKA